MMLSYASMEGLPLAEPGTRTPPTVRYAKIVQGFLLALVLAVAASWLAQNSKLPLMLCALILGMSFHFLYQGDACRPGIDFASRSILRFGVALLGVRVTAGQVIGLGLAPIITVMLGTLSTIMVGAAFGRVLGLGRKFGILSGSAVGICGASAAMAVSTVLPSWQGRERDTVLTVVVVTALSTIAMLIYPVMAGLLGLSHQESAIFFGGAIHDVAQVVGAGYMISPETGDVATYVKLLRVALLLPICFFFGFFLRGTEHREDGVKLPVPYFLLGFAALVVINSLGWLPKVAVTAMSSVSQWSLAVAIVALGAKTSFRSLVETGWKPIALMIAETVWIGGFVLLAILSLH